MHPSCSSALRGVGIHVTQEATDGELEPATRRNLPFFGSVIQSIRRKGSMRSLAVNNVQHARVSPTNSYSPAEQNSFSRNMSDKDYLKDNSMQMVAVRLANGGSNGSEGGHSPHSQGGW